MKWCAFALFLWLSGWTDIPAQLRPGPPPAPQRRQAPRRPVDAIVGAAKQMHTVIAEACHGCGKCEPVCNTMAITLKPIPKTVATWYWPKPGGSVH